MLSEEDYLQQDRIDGRNYTMLMLHYEVHWPLNIGTLSIRTMSAPVYFLSLNLVDKDAVVHYKSTTMNCSRLLHSLFFIVE